MVWTNERVIKWVQSVDLKDYANNLIESGVHGSLIALDDSIDHNSMALALQIATANTQVGCHTGHWAEGGFHGEGGRFHGLTTWTFLT